MESADYSFYTEQSWSQMRARSMLWKIWAELNTFSWPNTSLKQRCGQYDAGKLQIRASSLNRVGLRWERGQCFAHYRKNTAHHLTNSDIGQKWGASKAKIRTSTWTEFISGENKADVSISWAELRSLVNQYQSRVKMRSIQCKKSGN